MIVVDANVIAYLFIPGPFTDTAAAVLRRDAGWVAPRLWRSEFRNVLAQYIRNRSLSATEAAAYAREAERLLHEQDVQTEDVLRLVMASTRSAYDCEYVALAEALGVPLVTNDGGVLRDFPEVAVSMEAFASA